MRIVQVVADGRPGGGTVMVLSLLEALAKPGLEACLITDAGSYAAGAARERNATVAELPFFVPASATRRVGAALDRLAPDVVHVHGSRAAFHVAPWVRRHPEVSSHYTVHGYHFHHRSWPRRVMGRWAERRSGRRLPSVIHVCDFDRRLAEQWGLVAATAPRRVIYNGVDPSALPPAAKDDPPRVAFVGRLVQQKDPVLIAAIARRLAAAGIGATIVGGGERESGVRRLLAPELAGGAVELTGAVDRHRALTELARATVLVLPSRWEGLPVVLLEALAMGVPVVAASVGGVPEIVTDGETGLLVDDRRPETFVEAVRLLLGDDEMRRRLCAAGRARIEARFHLRRCIEQYSQLYGL